MEARRRSSSNEITAAAIFALVVPRGTSNDQSALCTAKANTAVLHASQLQCSMQRRRDVHASTSTTRVDVHDECSHLATCLAFSSSSWPAAFRNAAAHFVASSVRNPVLAYTQSASATGPDRPSARASASTRKLMLHETEASAAPRGASLL